MAFNWIGFLDANHVHYATTGPNVSRGNVAVKCPWCGAQDPSEHMSINLDKGAWRCFRRPAEHYGKSPARLVMALIGCSPERARSIVGESVFIPDDFLGAVQGLVNPAPPEARKALILPDEFKSFRDLKRSSKPFVDYLRKRKFTLPQIKRFSRDYDMYYATSGRMKGRVVFAIYFEDELVTWTGRTIYPDQDLRYKTLSIDSEKEPTPAVQAITQYLLFYDDLLENKHDCHTLMFCEGPFDALKVNVVGRPHGIAATCFFTASPSRTQIDLAGELISRYRHRFLLLDRGTLATALRAQIDMHSLKLRVLTLPEHLKDPGEIDEPTLLDITP